MRTRILIKVVLLLLIFSQASSQEAEVRGIKEEPVKIVTTPATRNLAETWMTEYGKQYPELDYQLISANLDEMTERLDDHSVGFVIQQPGVSLSLPDNWIMTVGREVIVPVMNDKNPFKEELRQKGISATILAEILRNNMSKNWGSLLQNGNNETFNLYLLNDPEVKHSVSKFLEVDPPAVLDLESISTNEFVAAISSDKNAIGFCRLTTVLNPEQEMVEGVRFLPVDRNNNGRLDNNENIYADLEQFERSVWIGKYPHELIYNVYALTSAFPKNEQINSLLNWITTTGQPILEQSGLTELAYAEKQSNLEKLISTPMMEGKLVAHSSRISTFILGVFLVLAFGLLLTIIIYFQNRKRSKAPLLIKSGKRGLLNQEELSFPKGLYFDKTHTWVFMGKKGHVKLGIDDFMPNVTGEITRVIMKNPGDKVKRMEPLVTLVRKGKQLTINSPVSGTICEVNESLSADPFLVNLSPYKEGWVYKIQPSNWFREIGFFMLGENYKEWIKIELNRLKDFLACSLNLANMKEGKLVFQEGGEIMIHPLKDMDPKIWEEFQSHFINTSDMY